MTTKNNILALAAMFSLALGACNNAPQGEAAATADAAGAAAADAAGTAYTVDAAQSNMQWEGTKTGGAHKGTIAISTGEIGVSNGNITSGTFDIDMKSINVTDLTGKEKGDLEGHLKVGDFFDVEKFPAGKFAISKVEAMTGDSTATHKITGDLTLKGVTKSVSFPANVMIDATKVSATSSAFTINRTEWGITYSSGVIGTAKDKLINDNIGIVVKVVANAKAAAAAH